MRAKPIVIASVLVLAGACAKSEAPMPNKNTNWLEECSTDAQCAEPYACLCGVCTERCTSDDACAEHDGAATCRHERSAELIEQCGDEPRLTAVCVSACEDDADCEQAGEGAHCEHGACIASTNTFEEPPLVGEPGGGESDAPCVPLGDDCAPLVATGLELPSGLAVQGERVYWLDRANVEIESDGTERFTGSFESALVSGADRVTLARDLHAPEALALDDTHAYFLLAYLPPEEPHTKLVRVPLAGGELEVLFDAPGYSFTSIAVDETDVYCAGANSLQVSGSPQGPIPSLYRIPKAGLAPELAPEVYLTEMIGRPTEIVMHSDTVYWKNGTQLQAVDIDYVSSERAVVIGDTRVTSEHPHLAVTDSEVVWIASDQGLGIEISRVDALDPTQGTTNVYEEGGAPIYGFAADAQHVWWTVQAGQGLRRFVRTDRANGQTVTLVSTPASLLQDVHVALSEDYVLVASSNSALGNGPKPGFIARLHR